MTKEKKERTQYNWKFKENESEEFYKWFDNQDNISSSLRSILYHIIEIYGNGNILDPSIQKRMITDNIILESLKNKDVISVNHELIFGSKQDINNLTSSSVGKKNIDIISDEKKEVINTKENDNKSEEQSESNEIIDKPEVKRSIYSAINKNLI
ncbi:MAG: hypothetical protein WAM95_21480 [Bacillus sp. (in: firmicutes)]